MKCAFRGNPLPEIFWFKNEAPIEQVKGKIDIRELPSANGRMTSRLRINQLDTHDTGYYKCEARSAAQSLETIGILKVLAGTHIFSISQNF
ncbi:tyrosine-protein kinase transmembrane receptor ROR1-like protein [Dinothrombium tinctorium]|uniref:Tyrosine-protein kinase transmembrane receptor ROR1-like protein n=1 Tax=Dinothrombium tinctorium TaxID=1965070 RepID=A0A3S3PIL5_9ACAR|nr:tyrosine-protein kinase transmembrane receptor ROR1-like protein [Dinothrombium tinctorium]